MILFRARAKICVGQAVFILYFVIKYKIKRGTTYRVGELVINASTTAVSYDDTYNESNGDVGVTLSAEVVSQDSTGGNDTLLLRYITTNTSTDATLDYQVTIIT